MSDARRRRRRTPTLDFLAATARNAAESSDFVRQASAAYRTPVDYGIGNAFGGGLQRVAALIAADMPTRLYYVVYQGNSFDTHVQQADLHSRLLMYTADAVRAFMEDIARIGRGDDVAVMMFTEFGRRVEENGSLGTDHGTATPMFLFGKHVKGGLLRPAAEPDRSGRRQPEDDDRLPPRLRDRDQGVARLRRHRGGAQGALRPARRVCLRGVAMWRTAACLIAILLTASSASAQVTGQPRDNTTKPGTAVVRGRVIAADTGRPIRRAQCGWSPNWTLKAVRLNGLDVTDAGFDVRANEDVGDLEVELTTRISTLSGLVTNSRGERATDYTAVIFPQDRERWTDTGRHFKTAQPDQDGRYEISGLPAEPEYLAIAVDGIDPSEAATAEFLERSSTRAVRFTLGDAETKSVDLKLTIVN